MPANQNLERRSIFGPNPTAPRTFPLPGNPYYRMLYDPKSKKQF